MFCILAQILEVFPGHRKRHVMLFPVHWTAQRYSKWRICSSVYVLCLKKKVPPLSQTAVSITWCSHKKFLVRTILNGYPRETNFGHGILFRSSPFFFILIRKFEKSVMLHSYRHTQGDLRFEPIFMSMSNTPSPSRRVLPAPSLISIILHKILSLIH